MNTAIIVAAGSGKRFGTQQPKQFRELLGRPVIFHTLSRFEACPDVSSIILVLAADEIENFRLLAADEQFAKISEIVPGGRTRAESVSRGLAAVDPATEIVAVHDGARPLVTASEISATIERARATGAACLVAPVTETIKEIEGEFITGTPDRRGLRRALTPQAFRLEILRKAFAGCGLGEEITDDCSLVEKIGHRVAFVEGNPRNIKITHPEDLLFAETALRNGDC